MHSLIQLPTILSTEHAYPLWIVLHGAFSTAEDATLVFGSDATTRNVVLLAPQATRPCGAGYCWSFAHDASAIRTLLDQLQATYPIDPARIAVIGHSMGCAMGCWLLAQNPGRFAFFAAFGMGSVFEPWEHDDGGIDEAGLQATATSTQMLLAVDQADPGGNDTYFADNLLRLQRAGLHVETFRPQEGTHAVTAAMKAAMLEVLPF
jgi:poly(3-hydroxybutyrate) depolymerase